MHCTPAKNSRGGRQAHSAVGFTMVEMLGVLFVAGVILAITFPTIRALQSGSRAEAGINTASVAVDVTRAWATNGLPPVDVTSQENYSGTAAIFTPAREIRIVTEDLDALNTVGNRLAAVTTVDGYQDRPGLDYVAVPSGVGYVGVRRTAAGGLELLPPPFAIAFTENGQLKLDAEVIAYDGNQDEAYAVADTRPSPYIPRDWERDSANGTPDSTTGKRNLPFEAIETVSAVIAFDLNDFYSAFGRGDWPPGDTARNNWIRQNGRVLMFSPMTGIAFRDEAR